MLKAKQSTLFLALSPISYVMIIEEAIADEADLDIVYLKTNDTKTKRQITPFYIDEMQYKGKDFEGLRAFCQKRQEERTFRIDRILEINTISY